MTDDEAYEFAEKLLPIAKRSCPECRGVGSVICERTGVLICPPALTCRCGGSGKMTDNVEWLREHNYMVLRSFRGKDVWVKKKPMYLPRFTTQVQKATTFPELPSFDD